MPEVPGQGFRNAKGKKGEGDAVTQKDYWSECLAVAAEECDLKLSLEQLDCLASAAQHAYEYHGMAFYQPPPGERLSEIEDEWKRKLKEAAEQKFERYQDNAEAAVRTALRVHRDAQVSIGEGGSVFRHGGRTEQLL